MKRKEHSRLSAWYAWQAPAGKGICFLGRMGEVRNVSWIWDETPKRSMALGKLIAELLNEWERK